MDFLPEKNILHVLPINDLKEHVDTTTELYKKIFVNGEIRQIIHCDCECRPIVEYTENNGAIIVHNSFDGREYVEWANEILNNQKE